MIDNMYKDLYKKVEEIFTRNHTFGHDIKHCLRVSYLAKYIAMQEKYNTEEAAVAGLLHDLGRALQSETGGHAEKGVPLASELLNAYTSFNNEATLRILSAIKQHSNKTSEGTLSHILQDADKLDGIGAIGISRTYMNKHFLPDYDSDYLNPQKGSYNETRTVYEQLLLQLEWFEMLYTETAKKLAAPRHKFMEQFLNELKREIKESSN